MVNVGEKFVTTAGWAIGHHRIKSSAKVFTLVGNLAGKLLHPGHEEPGGITQI
jgi:hypothetical protein